MPNRGPVDAAKASAFLAEAMPVVVSLGGINSASMARLRGIAHKHGLDSSQMESLLHASNNRAPANSPPTHTPHQPAGAPEKKTPGGRRKKNAPPEKGAAPPDPAARAKAKKRKALFAKHAARTIRKAGALWPPVYERLLHDSRRARLEPLKARRLIEWVARQLDLPYIPSADAEDHLRDLTRQLVRKGQMTISEAAGLKASARQLGISSARLQALVDEVMRQHPAPTQVDTGPAGVPRRRESNNPWMAMMLVAACAGLVALSWYAFMRFPKKPPAQAETAAEALPDAKPVAPQAATVEPQAMPVAPKRPAWVTWGSDALADRLVQAEQAQPEGQRDTVRGCGQADAGARKSAYGRLAKLPGPAITDLLATCFLEDPDPANAQAILDQVRTMPAFDPKGAWTEQDMDQWLGAAERLAVVCLAAKPKLDRAVLANAAYEEKLGGKPPAAGDRETLVSDARKQTLFKAYQHVASHAEVSPGKALELCELVRKRSQEILGGELRLVAETMVAQALFDSTQTNLPPETLEKAKRFFGQLASMDNPDRVKLVQLFEAGTGNPLQNPLQEALAAISNVSPDLDPKALATAFRKQLSIQPAATSPAERAAKLRERSQAALGSLAAHPDNLKGQLAEILRLAQASSLACALVGLEKPQNERFDALAQQAPDADFTNPAGTGNATGPSTWVRPFQENQGYPGANLAIPIKAGDESRMVRFLATSSANDRAIAFASLCHHVDPSHMSWEVADGMARYLIRANLHSDELILIQYNLPRVASAPNLKLALSEKILLAPRTCPGAFLALGEIVGVVPDQGPKWRESARRSLLESLAYGGTHKTSVLLAAAADKYVEILKEQGRLLGVAEPEYLLQKAPSAILATNTRHLASGLVRDKLTTADKRFLQLLPHWGTILAYLKQNDLQITAFQQRQFLRVLELQATQRNPALSPKARGVADELAQADKASDNVLTRLISGEKAILRMWLLLREEPK